MHIHSILAVGGLAAFAVAAPAATSMPMITAAPVVPRQFQPGEVVAGYTLEACSFESATTSGSPVVNCACGTFTTELPKTVISNTPMVVCGGVTSRDPYPSEFSAQPLVSAPAQVAFGDFHPTDLISAISASCANGCAATTTTLTTATSIHSGAPVSEPTKIAIEYVVSTQVLTGTEFTSFMDALSAMIMGASKNETFNYRYQCENGFDCDPPIMTQTNYYAPAQVQFSRFTMDNTGSYTDTAGVFEVAITSEVVDTDNSALCGEIEGPIAAALGAVPEIGPVFGVIGSVLCDLFNS